MDRLDSEVGGDPPRPDSATGAETQDHYWAEFEGATPQPEASNLKEGPDHFWAEFEGADQQLDSGKNEASLDHNGEELEEESPRPAPVRNDALSKSLAEEKRSASRRFTWVWMMLAPYLLVLPFAPIIELFPEKESTESRCYGNGQTSYHLLGECWDRLDGDYIGEVGNYSLDGTNYTVHAWEVPTEDRDQQWISDAVYVRLDVWAGFGWAEYYTYFECQASTTVTRMWITTTKRGPPLRQGNGSTAMTPHNQRRCSSTSKKEVPCLLPSTAAFRSTARRRLTSN